MTVNSTQEFASHECPQSGHVSGRMKLLLSVLALLAVFSLVVPHVAKGRSRKRIPNDLHKLASFYGFPSPVASGETVTLRSKYTELTLHIDSRKLEFNRLLIWMHDGLVQSRNTWLLSQADVYHVIDPLLRADNVLASQSAGLVVIDAGHGGSDTGAISTMLRANEKAITLDLAKRTQKRLARFKTRTRLTRTTDRSLSLSGRAVFANAVGADLFVSIHLNRASSPAASGVETYVMPSPGCRSTSGMTSDKKSYPNNRYDDANMILAYYVHKGLLSYTKAADRGIKRARFSVLRDMACPAILVECGFLSSRHEERKLMDTKYRDDVAAGISAGVLTYLSRARNAKAGLDRGR